MTILFHSKHRVTLVQATYGNVPISRYKPTAGLYGTALFTTAPFYLANKGLFQSSGRLHIRHTGYKPYYTPPRAYDGVMYANARIKLFQATTESGLPVWPSPNDGTNLGNGRFAAVIALDGMNIFNSVDHYAKINLAVEEVLAGGYYYRAELWAGAGIEDEIDEDGTADLNTYNGTNTHQWNITVLDASNLSNAPLTFS